MSANVSVDFDKLKSAHPSHHEIGKMIDVPSYVDETCSVQVSWALNHAGAIIANYAYPDPQIYKGKVRAYQGRDGLNYIFAVPDLRVYLDNTFGVAENYKGSKDEMQAKIQGRHGILAFGHRHIDLWEGARFHWQALYLDLWTFESTKKRGIFFWEVTSRWGF